MPQHNNHEPEESDGDITEEQAADIEHNRLMLRRLQALIETTKAIERAKEHK